MAKMKNQGEQSMAAPKQESDSHAGGEGASKFIGTSAGNANRPSNISGPTPGGMGESHPFSASGPFLGDTKGNKDRPIDISRGSGGGDGGAHIAGRGKKVFAGNKGGFPKS